jgi:uncharacterized repeat protein (TIGR03837 family)
MTNFTPRCDIFCAVVDNYGDAGVCWRLARQLALEHGWRVRLWIDNATPLRQLAPDHDAGPVAVRPWPADFPPVAADDIPHVVIETFACTLPARYVGAMARCGEKPVWINLDHLSAEDWVAGCHALPSPHPQQPLVKHFFFPGFTAGTGGLLRERDYDQRRQAFDEAAWRTEFGLPPRVAGELTLSLFSYPQAPLQALLDALAAADAPIHLLRPGSSEAPGRVGNLYIHPLPFLPQPRYDELLWTCDVNFVRGEDSFVRAQWAAKPFIWQIYPQTDAVHRIKLDAFLGLYEKVGAGDTAIGQAALAALIDFWHAWNGDGTIDWNRLAAALPQLVPHAQAWSEQLSQRPDLTTNLVQFCLERLK